MANSKWRRISDVTFKFDKDLNVVEANRSFLQLFNVVAANINLGDFMNPTDKKNFAFFIANFHEGIENPYFLVDFNFQDRFSVALINMSCIVHVQQEGKFYSASLQEISQLFNMFDKLFFDNR